MRPKASATETSQYNAFNAVFESEFSYVCRALRRLGVIERDLEDLAQDVFLAIYKKWNTRDLTRPLRPWLFGFAFRVASNYRRGARHRVEVGGAFPEHASAAATPEDDLVRGRTRARLIAALQHVPLERRSVLIMHDVDGFSAPDIAETLSIPVNTVYSRVRVGREELQKALRRGERKRGSA